MLGCEPKGHGRLFLPLPSGKADYAKIDSKQMTLFEKARNILTDSHFLIPLIVFCIGLALLITLH
jgi:hypothetical protein